MRLKPKITIGTLLILLVCILVSCSFFLARERLRLEQQIELQGKAMARLVARFCTSPMQQQSYFIVQEVARTVEQAQGVAFCEIYDADGKALTRDNGAGRDKSAGNNPPPQQDDELLVIENPIEIDRTVIGKVRIGFELAPVHQEIRSYIISLAVAVPALLVMVGVAINTFLSRAFISPVVNLSEVVGTLALGEFIETRIARRSDEIGELARAFNLMSANLKQLYLDLEKKVDERTADLAGTNRRLEHEIERRQAVELNLKAAKEAAERANRYKSNFIANMSHEIRTPLNAILGYAQILRSRDDLDGQAQKAVEAIDRGGSHLLGLINDILDLSRIEAGRMELKPVAFDLCLLLRNMADMFRLRCAEKNLSWQVLGIDTDRILPVTADAGKLRQILINLLGNAVKFTTRGAVILRLSESTKDRYRFCIEDTGSGIPEIAREWIFDPFSVMSGSGGHEGTGLGLSITSRVLGLMDSRLEVQANQPHGTRFCFELQLPPAEISTLPKDTSRDRIRGLVSAAPLTALIIDDDRLSRTMLSHLLAKAEITALEASNGLEALEMLQNSRPDIIFMDRYMPEMDGADAIKEIQHRFGAAAPPVVMITAAAFDSPGETMAQPGVAGILIKPCDIRQVFTCMATVLGLPLRPEPDATASEPAEPPTFSGPPAAMSLPEELQSRLLAAAELGQISRLRELARELEATPTVSSAFAGLFRKHLEVYAMKEIIELVQQTKPTGMNRP